MTSHDEEILSENSEMRFLVLELMRLASKKGTSFDLELAEFIDNTYKLREALFEEHDAAEESMQAQLRKLVNSPQFPSKEKR
ncbi:MAG: hypothetical protein WC408_05385 [Candidatus Micrarchaeia archaeon]|jgi:hypothetical protein